MNTQVVNNKGKVSRGFIQGDRMLRVKAWSCLNIKNKVGQGNGILI